jgi:hypothetical protein
MQTNLYLRCFHLISLSFSDSHTCHFQAVSQIFKLALTPRLFTRNNLRAAERIYKKSGAGHFKQRLWTQ